MSANNTSSNDYQVGDMEDLPSSPRKIPSLSSLFHILWLRKWIAFSGWLVVAIPVGILLSIYNLPKSYSATTVLRFPEVVGAQTNVMRDMAITQGQSIISIFNSYQVLDGSIRKLGLRLRVSSPHTFQRDVFQELTYGENLGLGSYSIEVNDHGTSGSVSYKPVSGKSDYKIFNGPFREPGHLSMPGLEIQFTPEFLKNSDGKKIDLSFITFEDAFRELKKNVSARPLGGGNFEIRLKDRDPVMVADILNVLRDQFLDVYYGTSEVQEVGVLVQMEKDLELAKSRLEKSQDELSGYYTSHPELIQQPGSTQGENIAYLDSRQQIEFLKQRRNRVQQTFAAKEPGPVSDKTLFWAMELLAAMSEAGEAKANILRASLLEMNSRQTEQKRTLAPNHPKIQEVEAEMEAVYKDVETTEAALVRRLDQDLSEQQNRMLVNTPRASARPAVKVQLELERLNNVNTNNQNIYDRLLESYNRAKLVTGSEFFKVSVVDQARPAVYEPPSRKTRLLVATAAVLFLMVLMPGIVLVWGVVFIKIWTKDDVRRLLNLKSLGVIVVNKKKKSKLKKAKEAGAKAGMTSEASGGSVDPLLLVYGEFSRGEDLESYRHVREEVENAFRNRAFPGKFCIMITSSRPHEGKSTCAANLAITFARKGKRTLLIDADFRLGRTARMFNQNVGTGIDTLLDQTDMTSDQFLESATFAFQPTIQRNLVIAPRKSAKPNASELVSSDRFKDFIKLCREQFDVVIIDTPPIMITPDPLSLAELADGIIFVCRAGLTVASEAREAVEILRERNSKVAALVNAVKSSPFEINRYTKYAYYYQAQPGADSNAG